MLLILQSGGRYNTHYNLNKFFDMAAAYFVWLKRNIYQQYIGNEAPITNENCPKKKDSSNC